MSDPIGGRMGGGASAIAQRWEVEFGQGFGQDDGARKLIGVGDEDAGSFGDTLTRMLGQVSGAQDAAADNVARFSRGEPVELHQVMGSVEEAGIALEMLVGVRDKVLEAYRVVMNMQV